MRIVALLHEAASIRRILEPRGLWKGRKGRDRGTPPFHEPEQAFSLLCEPVDDDWPACEEPMYHTN